ncbi:MAG: energy-coupling factor transporter transmembrane protein EcfT [Bacteroidales bacterium]|nr:energy-coupling factor transporter transmembrane protein EcfT [Bacteroidales bacterium]
MVKASFFSLIIFSFISLYWILPSLIIVLEGVVLQPDYVLTVEMLNAFSRPSLLSVFRLMGDWWPRISLTPIQFIPNWLGIGLTFTIPIIALLSVILYKNNKRYGRYVIFLAATSLFIIFLNKGNQVPISWFYQKLYEIPILGWMFRVPSKWAMLLAFPYTLLATLTIYRFIGWSKNFKNGLFNMGRKIAMILIITFIFTSTALVSWPMFTGDFGGAFKPEEIPDEYLQLYDWLEKQNSDFKILMYPFPPEWGIPKSTIKYDNYWKFTESKLLNNQSDTISKLLSVWGVRYIILREDTLKNEEKDIIRSKLTNQENLRLVKTFGSLKVFENENYIDVLNVPMQNMVSTKLEDLASLVNIDYFNPINSSLLFLDQMTFTNKYDQTLVTDVIIMDENSLDLSLSFLEDRYVIKPFDAIIHHNPSEIWSKAGTGDPLHGPWHSYLEKRNIENWEFDYGKGLIFTWAPSILEEPLPLKKEDIFIAYDFEDNFSSWSVNAPNMQKIFLTNIFHHGKSSLAVELNASEWGWKTVSSSLIPVTYESQYKWVFYVKGKNAYKVHARVNEYNEAKELLESHHMVGIGSGDFDWEEVCFNFIPGSFDSKYMQLHIWHGHETNQTLPNKMWIDDVKIYHLNDYLKPNSLEMPFNIEKDGSYELFIRYFKNQDGGKIGLHLDGNLLNIIETEDQLNKFTWGHLKTLDLKRGSHTLTLENIVGFNAVNIFALIPANEYKNIEMETYNLLKDKRVIYLFETETDLYRKNTEVLNVGGKASNGELLQLQADSKIWGDIEIQRDGNYTVALRLNGSALIKIDNQTFTVNSTYLNFVYFNLHLMQGQHRIELLSEQYQPIIWTFDKTEKDFEEWKENTPESLIYDLSQDMENEKNCLKAELNNSTWGWKTINSPLIPVNSDKEYLWEFEIKGENAHAVHAKVVEYNKSKNIIQAVRLGSIGDGIFDWKNVSFPFKPTSANTSYMQLQIWHGHNTPQPLPNTIWLDNVRTYGHSPSQIDVLWIYSAKENETIDDIFSPKENPAKIITYEKVDPTKYIIKINATSPFMLSFAESYDPLWVAYVDGTEYQPVPLYSIINGFWINKTGDLEIVLRYKPQDWFEIGSIISITALIGCVGYLLYDWKKNDKRIEMIKIKIYTILKRKK